MYHRGDSLGGMATAVHIVRSLLLLSSFFDFSKSDLSSVMLCGTIVLVKLYRQLVAMKPTL